MKKFLLILSLFLSSSVFAQSLLLEENFNYADGSLLTANGWTAHSGAGTAPIKVTSPGLTYANYISSGIGNAALVNNTGEDDNKAFTAQTGGVFYLAFMVKVDVATQGYFIHLLNTSSTFAGRVWMQPGTVPATQFQFGFSNGSTATYNTTNFMLGTTYLCVVKYDFSTGTTAATSSLWVFSSGVPATEADAGTALLTSVGSGQASLSAIALRQYSSTQNVTVDGIRVATTWSALLPGATLTSPIAASATNITATGFTANWSASSAATKYFLDVSTTSDFSTLLADYNNKDVGNVTTVDLTSLNANTQYYYRVRATDGTTTTSNSNTISVMTLLTSPAALPATDITTTGFTANWNHSTDATSYKIDVSTSSDFSTLITDYNNKDVGSDTTAIVSSLTPGTTYYYRVRGSTINNTSGNSNSIMVSTENLAIPLAPVAKEVTNITTTSFTANWNSSLGAAYYSLDVSTDEAFSNILSDYNDKNVGLVTMLNVSGLTPSTNYYYRIRASNSGGTSPNSNTISVITALAAPVAIAATNITQSGFTANWNAETNVTNYWLDVSTDSTFSSFIANYNNKDAGNATSMTVTSLSPNITYYYRVSASNNNGSSPYSNTITVTTTLTGVDEILSGLPSKYDVYQNYPNPFNPSTVIKYEVPQNSFVNINVYDILGNKISTLVNQEKPAGRYELKFDASNLPSGIYFYIIRAGSFSQTKKMMLMK